MKIHDTPIHPSGIDGAITEMGHFRSSFPETGSQHDSIETSPTRVDGWRPINEIKDFTPLKNPIPDFSTYKGEISSNRKWADVPRDKDPETGRDKIRLKSGMDSDVLNQHPLPENCSLIIQDKDGGNFTIVSSDGKGRISLVERPIIAIADIADRQRDPVQTSRTVVLKDGKIDSSGNRMDDGGHLIADQFQGSSEQTNLVPMDSEVNQHGPYRDMERQIVSALKKEPPSSVTDFKVRLFYDGDSARPTAFEVSYKVDGEPVQHAILNDRTTNEVRNAA